MEYTSILPRRPRSRNDIQEELVGDRLFLYRADAEEAVHCLNSSAAVIWLLCDGTRDLASIAREVSVAYHIPEAGAVADIRATLAQFNEFDLLEANSAS